MSGLRRKAVGPSRGRPGYMHPVLTADAMEEQLDKVEKLLDQGATLDQAKVDLAKLFVQEYDHESSRYLINAGKEEVQSNITSMVTSAAAAAISGMRSISRPPTKSNLYARAEKIADLHICPDEDFRLQVSVTRRSLKIIFDAVRLVNNDFEYNDLLMLIWYLSSEESTLEEVASVFEIQDAETVLQRLVNTSKELLRLRKNAKMDLPSEFEEDDIVECFYRRTGVEKILGALGVIEIETQEGRSICALAVCDHRHYFRHLSLYTDKKITGDIIRSSPIFERLMQDHPNKYTFLCPAEGYPTLPQLFPGLQPDEFDLFDEMKGFALRHQQVVNYVRTSVKETLTRFPKLYELETVCPEIVMAAFMLHNFCIDTRDSSMNYDELDSLFPSLPKKSLQSL